MWYIILFVVTLVLDQVTKIITDANQTNFTVIKNVLNIDVLSPHKLRHFYATTIYNKSLDIYLTCTLLGHSDIKMTQIYLDINNDKNQEKNQIFNPISLLDPLTL